MWLHKPPVNQAIYQLKYHNQRYVAKYFAQEICIKYAEEIRRWRPQALVPVPLHRKRRRKRGYNQAELLAEEIGKILGIPVVANLVKRVHYTGYQKKLDPIGRKKNLEHAFAPGGDPDRLPTDFRRVIIIDDIYTTEYRGSSGKSIENYGVPKSLLFDYKYWTRVLRFAILKMMFHR